MNFEGMVFYRRLLDTFRPEIQTTLENHMKNLSANVANSEAPLIIRLELNYHKLATNDEMKSILCEIVDEPLQSKKDIREAAWIYISNLFNEMYYMEPMISLQLQQIHCIVRFSGLPLNEHFEFVPFRHPVRLSLRFSFPFP